MIRWGMGILVQEFQCQIQNPESHLLYYFSINLVNVEGKEVDTHHKYHNIVFLVYHTLSPLKKSGRASALRYLWGLVYSAQLLPFIGFCC